MKLNPSKGNMYDFVTHTGNAIKGICPHNCSYCYVKRWGNQKPVRLDKSELNGPMEEGNFIFIGSSCDMFAEDIPKEWISEVLNYCKRYNNKYLFQSKNPERFLEFVYPEDTVFCTTIETNRWYGEVMNKSPHPENRAMSMSKLVGYKTYVTIEPIMDFDIDELISMIEFFNPKQVNIGADSRGNNLPEPSAEKVMMLIETLKRFTTIHRKSNLKRILNK